MKKSIQFISLIFCLLLLNACVVVNLTKTDEAGEKSTKSKNCSVHHEKMHKTLVRTNFGLSAYDFEYENSKYPNAKESVNLGCIIPNWPIHRLAIIYACDVCTESKRKKLN
jgi:hypothetical protein